MAAGQAHLKPTTRERYEGIVRKHIRPRWSSTKLADVAHADIQTSSIDTGWRRDGLAGHRATGRGPMQTCAFEVLMQTCPSRWRRAA